MYILYSIVQQVSTIEVILAVVSQLGAKLASVDRGQASKVIVGSCFLSAAVVLFRSIRWLVSRMSEVVPVMRIQGPRLASLQIQKARR